MPDGNSLELRTVVERFADSTSALDELGERLRALSLAEETQARAATALEASAAGIAQYSDQASAAAESLRAASESVQQATQAAAEFLADTDLKQVLDAVSTLTQSVSTLSGVVESQAAELHATKTAVADVGELIQGQLQAFQRDLAAAQAEAAALRQQVASAQQETQDARSAMSELQGKVATIPERTRKKAGI